MMTVKSASAATSPFRCRKTSRRSLKQSCHPREIETRKARPVDGGTARRCPVQPARHACKFETRGGPGERSDAKKFDPAAFRGGWPHRGWPEMEDEDDGYHVYEDVAVPPTPPPPPPQRRRRARPLPPSPRSTRRATERSCSDSELVRVNAAHEVEVSAASASSAVGQRLPKSRTLPEHGFYRCHDNLEDVNDRDLVPDLAPKLLREKRAHLRLPSASDSHPTDPETVDSFKEPGGPRRFSFDSGWGESEIADEDVLLGLLNESLSLPSLTGSASSASSGIGSLRDSCAALPDTEEGLRRPPPGNPCGPSLAARRIRSPPPPPLPPRNAPASRSTRAASEALSASVEALQHLSADLLDLLGRPGTASASPGTSFAAGPPEPESVPCRRTLYFSDASLPPDGSLSSAGPLPKPESNNNSIVSPSFGPESPWPEPGERRPGSRRRTSSLFRNPLAASRIGRQAAKRSNPSSTPRRGSAGRTPARRPTDGPASPPRSLKSTKRRKMLFHLASPFLKSKPDPVPEATPASRERPEDEVDLLPVALTAEDRREAEEALLLGLPVIPFGRAPHFRPTHPPSMTVRALATPAASRRLPPGYRDDLLSAGLPSSELLFADALFLPLGTCAARHCRSCTCDLPRARPRPRLLGCRAGDDYVTMDGRTAIPRRPEEVP